MPRLVEEELYQCTLQTRAFAYIERESGSGDLHSGLEVDYVVFAGEIPVGQRVFGEIGHYASGLLDHVVFCRPPFGYSVAGQVRHSEQEIADIVLACGETVLKSLGSGLEFGYTVFGLFGLFCLPFFDKRDDRGCEILELGSV